MTEARSGSRALSRGTHAYGVGVCERVGVGSDLGIEPADLLAFETATGRSMGPTVATYRKPHILLF